VKQLNELLEPFQSTVLGTLGINGYPFSSYAPFYYDGEVVYIFISDIATHAKNMQSTPRASAFFIEDEGLTENIFRRKRISLQCDVLRIAREETRFDTIMDAFQSKFEGGTLPMPVSIHI
jgi:putative heme iron utilization protein